MVRFPKSGHIYIGACNILAFAQIDTYSSVYTMQVCYKITSGCLRNIIAESATPWSTPSFKIFAHN